jgi:hypothetical protein
MHHMQAHLHLRAGLEKGVRLHAPHAGAPTSGNISQKGVRLHVAHADAPASGNISQKGVRLHVAHASAPASGNISQNGVRLHVAHAAAPLFRPCFIGDVSANETARQQCQIFYRSG